MPFFVASSSTLDRVVGVAALLYFSRDLREQTFSLDPGRETMICYSRILGPDCVYFGAQGAGKQPLGKRGPWDGTDSEQLGSD